MSNIKGDVTKEALMHVVASAHAKAFEKAYNKYVEAGGKSPKTDFINIDLELYDRKKCQGGELDDADWDCDKEADKIGYHPRTSYTLYLCSECHSALPTKYQGG